MSGVPNVSFEWLNRFSCKLFMLKLDLKDLQTVEDGFSWIRGVDDPLVRRILILRYVEGLTWQRVAVRLGGTSADSCRMMVSRYLSADKKRSLPPSRPPRGSTGTGNERVRHE